MGTSLQPAPKAAPASSLTANRGNLVQRKCACGGSPSMGGGCEECERKKRLTVQRYYTHRAAPSKLLSFLPQLVGAVGSGHDFSQVLVHPHVSRRIQKKLSIGEPTDQYEQQADWMAERVIGTSMPPVAASGEAEAFSRDEPMQSDAATVSADAGVGKMQTPGAAPAAAEPETTATEQTATAGLIVEDDVGEVGTAQMRKSEFLEELRAAVCAAADSELAAVGHDTEGCPYIEKWIGYYRAQSSQHGERALRHYAPEAAGARTAREYIPFVTERVKRAVAVWAATGKITGVPEGVSPETPKAGPSVSAGCAAAPAAGIKFKGREGGARDADPQVILPQLNSGHPLDSNVRTRMESAFGYDFSRVRVHTNTNAAGLATSLNARAFTPGSDVGLGTGEYQPGTLVGDALLAHELAHVVQQGGSVSSTAQMKGGLEHNSLEEDADNSAVGAIVSLLGRTQGALSIIVQNAVPRLKSGLSLQRCPSKKETCSEGAKNITVGLVKLRGSSRTPATDLAEANKIYKKCCVQFTVGQDTTAPNAKSDAWLVGDADPNVSGVTCSSVTAEEKKMYDGATSEYKLSSRMRAFYVQSLSGYNVLAFSRPPYCAKGTAVPYINHLLIKNDALSDTLAHEFGHILLDSGDHKGIDNPSDKNNLMFAPGRTGSDLDASQCKIIYNNA